MSVVIESPERLSRVDVAALFERYHAERHAADRAALIERFLPLARHLSRRYGTGSEREDVEQVAAVGLLKALDRYDPARGIAFTSFAVPTILGEIKRYFRDLGWSVRVPRSLQELAARVEHETDESTRRLGRVPTAAEIATRCDTTVEAVLEARELGTAHRPITLDVPGFDDEPALAERLGHEDRGFVGAERAADLDALLAGLPERDRAMLRMRFGDDLTQREIGERLGVSQMHVSRRLRETIAELRRRSASGGGER